MRSFLIYYPRYFRAGLVIRGLKSAASFYECSEMEWKGRGVLPSVSARVAYSLFLYGDLYLELA
jgi:hypothetical protein